MLNASLSRRPEVWTKPCCTGHGVHFYHDANELAERVMEHFVPAIADHCAAVLVAGPLNMEAFRSRAERDGFDHVKARHEGRLVVFDAQWLMDRFMVEGRPDPRRFRAIVGGQLRMLAHRYSGIHIYGEMVALLMDQDLPESAMALENMWCELANERHFNLLCAYPMDLFNEGRHARYMERVRSSHEYTLRSIPKS